MKLPHVLQRPALAGIALMLSACSTAKFYSQAVAGQWEILAGRQPVASLVADEKTPARLRQRLLLTQELRTFAEQHLQLPSAKAYATYTDLHRPHVVWVVFAAPEFSTQPYQWQYPILGKLDYRGFFKEADAKHCAQKLKTQGLDTVIGGVDAYSTLGFFNDPLLNTFIHDPETELAELLFHELTHRKIFLPGDTDFNEAFATATGQEGVRRWLRSKGAWTALRKYNRACEQEQIFAAAVLETKTALEKMYHQSLPLTAMRAHKHRMLQQLSVKIRHLPALANQEGYAQWASHPLNHARLNTVAAYQQLVPAFQRLLAGCRGDLALYFQKVAAMKSLTKLQRLEVLESGAVKISP